MRIFRRTYFIYPEIQKPLIVQIFAGLVILSLIQASGVFLAMQWLTQKVQADINLVVDHRVLGSWKYMLYVSIFLPIIVNSVIGLMILLYVSNKFAGPLFRLERDIDNYLNGSTNKIEVKFRSTDYLHSLAQKVNLIVSTKNKREL